MPTRSLLSITVIALSGSLYASGPSLDTTYSDLMRFENNIQETVTAADVNVLLGADTFYSNGFNGSTARVANIEAGHVWNGHKSLDHVSVFLQSGSAAGEFDKHATNVGSHIGGRFDPTSSHPTTRQEGIAHGAELWSGAIAASWNAPSSGTYSTSFNIADLSLAVDINNPTPAEVVAINASFSNNLLDPYREAMQGSAATGFQTADVINSSWGNSGAGAAGDYIAAALDGLANSNTGTTLVFSAGNSGPGTNNVGSPGSGFNSITVGALTNPIPGYNVVADFSSRSPSDLYIPTTMTTLPGVRAAVDIVAPGTDLWAATYSGGTGGNTFGGSVSLADDNYSPVAGTSFAAPIVAGGATLVVDAARQNGHGEAIDGRVVKSVLLNSADKDIFSKNGAGATVAWDNGQSDVGGVITTTQALDYGVGAGRMNLDEAFDQLLGGTTGVANVMGNMGLVETVGWDRGTVSQGLANEYFLTDQLLAGTMFTVTLDWYVDAVANATDLNGDGLQDVSFGSFDDLNLEVWKTVGGVADTKVAESISLYDNVEHLYFEILETADYMIRVVWNQEHWDFFGDANQETYGLAWSGTAAPDVDPPPPSTPVPAAPVLALLALGLLMVRRRMH